jgi:hypothetical protein
MTVHREVLIKRVVAIIDRHDPFSLRASGAPENEFEPQARRIVDARKRCRDQQSCLNVVWATFTDSFGESVGPRESVASVASEIFSLLEDANVGARPFWSKGNDEFRTPDPRNAPGKFYVLKDCCLLCGIPWEVAPELFGYDDNGCWVKRQPATQSENEKMLKVIAFQELDCIRSR